MKEKNEKDARNFGEEMKELQRTLDHDEKLKNFLFHKVGELVRKSYRNAIICEDCICNLLIRHVHRRVRALSHI